MKISPARIVNKFRTGYLVKKRREEEKGAEKIGVGVPYPYPYPYPYPFPYPGEAKPKEEAVAENPWEGIEISTAIKPRGGPAKSLEEEALRTININYPLIPRMPKKGEHVYAYSNVRWEPTRSELIYYLIEPPIAQEDKEIIEKIKRDLEERLDIDFSKLGVVRAREILREEIFKSFDVLKVEESRRDTLLYYIERDTMGFGIIEGLMQDANIEDISCDGVGFPIYIYHRDPRLASLRTNIVFEDHDELNSFAVKLAQKCNKTISVAEPLLDGALPDGSRVQATLGTDIARKGSNFTIRKFTEKPLTPTHMLAYKTLDSTELAYLWLAVEYGQSILISGGTATGKTSLLNALSLFIKPTLKVVSIEDTPELMLELPHWVPHVARSPLSIKGKVGEVTLFDLLKSSLRQRPDYIVMGEVRGKEAYVLFQQMATGHPSLATIHAASLPQLIDRLITPPINLPPSLIENIDIMIFLSLSKVKGATVRRTDSILEVVGIKDDRPLSNRVFEWKPVTDTYEIISKSFILKKISKRAGITEETIKEELVRRKMIIEWLLEREIFDYREVSKVVRTYYTDPERILNLL